MVLNLTVLWSCRLSHTAPFLAPLFFSLHINDISSDNEPEIRLFPDDCVYYNEIKYREDLLKLQKKFDLLGSFARK